MIIKVLKNVPMITKEHNLSDVIVNTMKVNKIKVKNKDIICVASKVVSITENRIVSLSEYNPSQLALEIHEKVPRKDPRIIQAIIEETGDFAGKRIDLGTNHIGAWLRNGLFLTSAGIDRYDENNIILLPLDADYCAKKIGERIMKEFGVNVGVIITDSDGRVDKLGATQVAIGVYGIPPLRYNKAFDLITKKEKQISETICDMLAASAGLLMGQRGQNKPVVIISGFEFDFDKNSSINDSLYNKMK